MTTFRRAATLDYIKLSCAVVFSIMAIIFDVSGAATTGVMNRDILTHRSMSNRMNALTTTAGVARGGGGARPIITELSPKHSPTMILSPTTQDLRVSMINTLLQTSFLIAVSASMVMFSPLPSITRHLTNNNNNRSHFFFGRSSLIQPEARAIKILSIISSISASIELLLSPFVGSLIDAPKLGRKRVSIILNIIIACATLCVVLHPCVSTLCLSRMINVIVGGFLVIVTNTIIADVCTSPSKNDRRTAPTTLTSSNGSSGDIISSGSEQMGSILGKQAAYASLGFLLGSVVGGRLAECGERVAYATSLFFSILATGNVIFRMDESLGYGNSRRSMSHGDDNLTAVLPSLKDGYWEKPLSSVRLFYQYGSRMRTLALLLLLQSAPMFMGDVFQMFAKEEWGLHPKDFSNLVALFGILSIVSNVSVPFIIQSLGVRTLTLLAIASSLIFPLTTIFSHSYRHVLTAACVGMLAGVQKLGTSAAMTSLASDLGVPQGRLQGEKASMLALLKIACPIVYGMLYLKGSTWKSQSNTDYFAAATSEEISLWMHSIMNTIGRKLPFVLNVFLGVCALGVSWQNL